MTAPTVAVTVDLAALGAAVVEGLTIKCRLDQNDAYNGEYVLAGTVSEVTDANGVAVFDLFPNNPSTGLGTTGSTYRFTARSGGQKILDETVQIPDSACNLSDLTGQAAIANSGLAGLLLASGGAARVGNAPAGNIAATTVQAAINELDTEKASLAQLRASGGSALVGHGSGTVADALENNVENFSGASIAAKIQAGLDALATAGGGTLHATRDYSVGATIVIPSKVAFVMDEHCTLSPTANVNVVRQCAGSHFKGRIDCSALAGWSAVALDFDGDANADPVPFRLHTKTSFDAELVGAQTSGNGAAIKLHADGATDARVMGVMGKARVKGFDRALWMRQTSTDHSKFVTGCEIDIDASDSLYALCMESSEPNGYDLDGNRFRIQLQPRTGTAVEAFKLCGQGNLFYLQPWDWDSVVGTAPYAITLAAGVRKTTIFCSLDQAHIQNNSTERSIYIVNAFGLAGFSAGEIRSPTSDGVMHVKATSLRFDNNKGVLSLTADGLNEYLMLHTDASNNTYLQGMNVASASLYLNARGSGAEIGFKFGGVTKASLTSAGNFNAERGSFNSGVTVRSGSTDQANFFNNITAAAGAPTGVPTNPTGNVPLYYDATANKLYVYNAGWRSTAALT